MDKGKSEEGKDRIKRKMKKKDTDVSHNNRNRIIKLPTTPRTRCIFFERGRYTFGYAQKDHEFIIRGTK